MNVIGEEIISNLMKFFDSIFNACIVRELYMLVYARDVGYFG